jgi:hypothetical protein
MPQRRVYGWKVWVNYGQGWEYELFELTASAAIAQKKSYRENCPQYPVKVCRGWDLFEVEG